VSEEDLQLAYKKFTLLKELFYLTKGL
jgi:hypothetical protein